MKKKTLLIFFTFILFSSSSLVMPYSNYGVQASVAKSSPSHVIPQFPWDKPGMSSSSLYPAQPSSAGMMQKSLEEIDPFIETNMNKGMMPGAVVFVARKGQIVKHEAYGYAVKYKDSTLTEMDKPIKMKENSIFDVASISKLFTTTAAMILYEQGKFQLDDPVAEHIPEFAQNGKETVTIRQLLTHTSGLKSGIPLYKQGNNREDRIQLVFQQSLDHQPGTTYKYSDLNLITLGALVEKWSGKRQDQFVKEFITNPLGMKDTMYNPPETLKSRVVATEYQANVNRGMVWGEVHDENTWSLDGVAGHAGVFSTAKDLGIFAHMFLNEGTYGHNRILKPATVKLMGKNFNTDFPGDDHGLGWELNQGWYMDGLSDKNALGHTGFTGTSIVVSPNNKTIAILLTNRVHPTRNTPSINPVRRGIAREVADSIPVKLNPKDEAWFAGYGDEIEHTLKSEINIKKAANLTFETWYRLDSGNDFGYVELSENGETWMPAVPVFTGNNGNWKKHKIKLSPSIKHIRFRYQTNASTNGRGWYVKNIQMKVKGKNVLNNWETIGWDKRNY